MGVLKFRKTLEELGVISRTKFSRKWYNCLDHTSKYFGSQMYGVIIENYMYLYKDNTSSHCLLVFYLKNFVNHIKQGMYTFA